MSIFQFLSLLLVVFFSTCCSQKNVAVETAHAKPEKVVKKTEKNSIKIKSPRTFLDLDIIKKINRRQARRKIALDALKLKGKIGEASGGFLKIRESNGLTQKDLSTMKKLVKVENNDRRLIYKTIKETEKYNSDQMIVLRDQMFKRFLELDRPGSYYYQNSKWLEKK